ncbi:MAG: class I SAM-dependent methyltransferase [Bacteroidota bacterium]
MKKRLHNNIILAIEQILQEVIERNRYGDRILEQVFKNNKQWGARDRKLIASATYDLIRWWRRYEYAAQLIRDKSLFRKAISAYLLLQDEYELPQWLLFNDLNYNTLKERYYDDTLPLPVKASIPDWLHEIGSKELGKSWETEINALNDQAKLIIRVNTLKTNKSQLMEYLKQSEIDCFGIDGYPDALCISKRLNVFQTELFKEGLFEVQDASSQLIAPFLEVTPGMRVIDACAGGGGKTLHLAALMQNRGKIISMDIEEHKLNELTKRSRRNGAHIIETRIINSTKVS